MGILDDAIREHLELKRRHGVPEQELQRQEEEALGPVRREVAAPETQDGASGAEDAAVAQEQAEAPAEPPAEEQPVEGTPEPPAEETEPVPEAEAPEPQAEEPLPEAEEPLPEADEQALEPKGDHPPPEPVFDPSPDEAPPAQFADTPQRGFEPVDPEEASEEDADMLEDTPDFLQETPEHDRLWFEQKPPRDFDFD